MRPGHGDELLLEADVAVPAEEEQLAAEFRRQLDEGWMAMVPTTRADGRRAAAHAQDFADVPRDAERVIFLPRPAGGR
jgi:hypothetical protein